MGDCMYVIRKYCTYLIEVGADVNVKISFNVPSTPLFEPVMYGTFGMVRCLVETGANTDTYRPKLDGINNAVAAAVYEDRATILEYLLDHGADADGDIWGQRAIDYAAENSPESSSLLPRKEIIQKNV